MFDNLSKKQIEKLSDIISDIGLISLAAVVIPSVLDKFDLKRIIVGLLISLILWIVSIRLKR